VEGKEGGKGRRREVRGSIKGCDRGDGWIVREARGGGEGNTREERVVCSGGGGNKSGRREGEKGRK